MDHQDFIDILDAVRTFVRHEVVPAEDEIEDIDDIPPRLKSQAAEMGLFGYALPEQYGGLGVTASEDVRLAFEFGYTAPAFRSMFGTNNGIAGQILVNFGTEAQRAEFLPGLASGESVASFALTEAEAGSDPSGLKTSARRVDEGYVINGQKRYITNADRSDLLMVFARVAPHDDSNGGISVFVVDTATPGVTVGPKDKKMGQRGSTTSEVFFDDVVVPADRLVGEQEGQGLKAAMTSLAKGRLHVAALCVGMAERLLDETLNHASVTRQGGTIIAEFQQVQAMLAESQTELFAGRSMVIEAAARYDDGTDRRLAPSCAKLFCSEMVGRVADRAVQVHGGMGYMHSVPAERFYRDARLYRIYEGTSEVQRVVIAKQLAAGRRA
ncbi:acyl-CoA dehydrogenase family protein [Gordonia sp. NPDC058843]|uniref:acyl-CoA dehydrogenase family protein n=1 Tax=Gordonia sp. NPDC058843 TaxID=3346648 RepID=UPI0036BB8CEE